MALTAASSPAWAGSRHHLEQQRRQAAHRAAVLDARAHHQGLELATDRRRLARLDAQANAALAALQSARATADTAKAASDAAQVKLVAAKARTQAARERLYAMAANAYRTEAAGGALGTTLSLVQTGNAQTFLDGIELLGQVGKSESAAVDDLRVAEAGQQRSEEIAAAATARAVATERVAAVVQQRADALVHQQQSLLARERTLLAATRKAAGQAHAKANALARRIAAAEARAAALRRAQALAVSHSGVLAKCNGGSVAGYSNGQLPLAALCPLWDAPGMMLQKAAAASFNQMSEAYAHAFGTPLCVTSSYRTYERQVELYATMPAGYAAVPGTSNHGWALAVDLCGGIQVDGSPQHQWLLDHAAAFHWFHPAWAMPGGAGPHEPWHWEYAG